MAIPEVIFDAPVQYRMSNGQLITLCPPGMAYGCFDLRSRGKGPDYAAVALGHSVPECPDFFTAGGAV